VQSIGRWKVVEWQQNVYLRGATAKWVLVSPGDFILADEDEAIVIPQAVVSETLARAEQLTEQETKLRLELQNGLGLEQALAEFGHV
jgi:regulator of RNase E activity RraA